MGCFWSPEARFGHLRGVIRTRVGYSGGTTSNPTYHEMGDHSETIEIDYDPNMITYSDILNVFWANHYPFKDNYNKGRQYLSMLLYHDEHQKELVTHSRKHWEQQVGSKLETEIAAYSKFFKAEDKHQKYYLKRYPDAIASLSSIYPGQDDLENSTLAARLNGFVKGFGTLAEIKEEVSQWEISERFRSLIIDRINKIRW